MSNPYSDDYFAARTAERIVPLNIKNIICCEKYICGMPEPKPNGWVEYGLMKKLIKWTTKEVLLEIPIIFQEGVFLRELKWISPKYLRSVDETLLEDNEHHRIMPSQFVNRKYHRWYINSTMPLKNYENNYEAPEIWLPAEVSLDLIKIVEIN